jgi:hypothetical protein
MLRQANGDLESATDRSLQLNGIDADGPPGNDDEFPASL